MKHFWFYDDYLADKNSYSEAKEFGLRRLFSMGVDTDFVRENGFIFCLNGSLRKRVKWAIIWSDQRIGDKNNITTSLFNIRKLSEV